MALEGEMMQQTDGGLSSIDEQGFQSPRKNPANLDDVIYTWPLTDLMEAPQEGHCRDEMKVLQSHSIILVISGKKILMDNNEIRVVLFDEKVSDLLVKACCSPGTKGVPSAKKQSPSHYTPRSRCFASALSQRFVC